MTIQHRKKLLRSILSTINDEASISVSAHSKTVSVLMPFSREIKGSDCKCVAMCGLLTHSQDVEFNDEHVPIAEMMQIFRGAHDKALVESVIAQEDFGY